MLDKPKALAALSQPSALFSIEINTIPVSTLINFMPGGADHPK